MSMLDIYVVLSVPYMGNSCKAQVPQKRHGGRARKSTFCQTPEV